MSIFVVLHFECLLHCSIFLMCRHFLDSNEFCDPILMVQITKTNLNRLFCVKSGHKSVVLNWKYSWNGIKHRNGLEKYLKDFLMLFERILPSKIEVFFKKISSINKFSQTTTKKQIDSSILNFISTIFSIHFLFILRKKKNIYITNIPSTTTHRNESYEAIYKI